MKEDFKTIMLFALMAVASAYIRYKGFFQATVDALLAFWFGYAMYLLLDYSTLSGASRTGISCILMLFSRPLYDWVENFIRTELTNLLKLKISTKGKNNDGTDL